MGTLRMPLFDEAEEVASKTPGGGVPQARSATGKKSQSLKPLSDNGPRKAAPKSPAAKKSSAKSSPVRAKSTGSRAAPSAPRRRSAP